MDLANRMLLRQRQTFGLIRRRLGVASAQCRPPVLFQPLPEGRAVQRGDDRAGPARTQSGITSAGPRRDGSAGATELHGQPWKE
jgi:hypothetical protein